MKLKAFVAIFAALLLALGVSYCAGATVGDVAGEVFSTDIVTCIDSMPIRSFNIGGRTVIVAEELANYGFSVVWNENARTISVSTQSLPEIPPNFHEIIPEKQSIGEVIGNFYTTDILSFVNGMWVESYNLGGMTALVVEDMATTDDEAKRNSRDGNIYRALGYAPSLMKCTFDGENRMLHLSCLRPDSRLTLADGTEVVLDGTPFSVVSYERSAWKLTDGNDLINQPTVANEILYINSGDFFVPFSGGKLLPGVSASIKDGGVYVDFQRDANGKNFVPKLLYESVYTRTNNVNKLLSPKLSLYISGEKIANAPGRNVAIIYGAELYLNVSLISEYSGGTLISYRYVLPEGLSPKRDDIVSTSTLLFINDRQIPWYDSASGKLYIAIKDLTAHGFKVETSDGKTWRITAPDSPVPLTEQEKQLHPESFFRHNERSRMYEVYDGIYTVFAGEVELNDVYIGGCTMTNLMPCIDITELCEVFGFSLESEYINGYVYRVYTGA